MMFRTGRNPSSPRATTARAAVLALILLGCGCAVTGADRTAVGEDILTRAPLLPTERFGPPGEVPSFEQLLALSDQQRAHFSDFYTAGVNRRHLPHQRIPAYLSRYLNDIDFGNRTLSVAETIDRQTGNCMSLALVTTALAREAGVKVGWQLADTDPVYSSEGTVIYSANHIQVRLYRSRVASTTGYTFAMGGEYLLLDYFTDNLPESGQEVSETQMIALVYQNLGVEAMADDDHARAYWLLREALSHDPANHNIYNALAVLYRRAGDPQTAETLFRFALDEFGDRLIVLRNYRKLLLAAGRRDEAAALEQRLLRLPDPDPYPMLALGDEARDEERYGAALAYYRKAQAIAPYLHEIHWKIAGIHAARGDARSAARELERARRKAMVEDDKQRYAAKLRALAGTH